MNRRIIHSKKTWNVGSARGLKWGRITESRLKIGQRGFKFNNTYKHLGAESLLADLVANGIKIHVKEIGSDGGCEVDSSHSV
jgi:hypothetical protein